MTRDYVLRRRAETVAETRRRITEAAVHLHGTVGPARTTISAIAEHAGVERLTVYRHFPDEAALFDACTRHWRAAHPPPDPAAWAAIADPEAQLRLALGELYAYYRRGRDMLELSFRDRAAVPALAPHMAALDAALQRMRDELARRWTPARGRRRRVVAAVGHAVDLRSWMSLADQGVSDGVAADLMVDLVRAAAAPSSR